MSVEDGAITTNVRLPPDVWQLLFDELASRNDFSSLYNCAVASKHLAGSGALALELLTRSSESHNAPVKSGGNEALPFQEQEQAVQRWSILWRTVLLSCTEETLFPYCHYLRVLDLRDLWDLLDDDKFRGKIQQ
jgi:hypothetical protein